MIIFIGDGVSDLPAARECDVLFCRRGLRLEEYCIEHNIAYIPFDTFKEIEIEVARIIKDDRKTKKETGIPKFYNRRYLLLFPLSPLSHTDFFFVSQSKFLEKHLKSIGTFTQVLYACSVSQGCSQFS